MYSNGSSANTVMESIVGGSASQVGVENVSEGGQRATSDLVGCIPYALQSLPAGCRAASIPHSDAASKDILNDAW